MPTPLAEDHQLTAQDVRALSSAEAVARFFAQLGYPAETRLPMTPEALGFNQTLTNAARHIERLASVEGALEIYLVELTSVTVAHTRALMRAFRDRGGDFLFVLTDDYRRLDVVLLDREIRPGARATLARPRVLTVDRRDPDRVALRVLRRFSFTEADEDGDPDPYAQYDKLQSAFTIAEWSEPFFNNRALFSDHYLKLRLPELELWQTPERNQAFRDIRRIFAEARGRVRQEAAAAPDALILPILRALGFRVEPGSGGVEADALLFPASVRPEDGAMPVAFSLTYPWRRYLDGKDAKDPVRSDENPGAQVVSLLDHDVALWAIVTNGKTWRLYSARAHSRATNYYEVDLEEILALTDPADAFRYFYLLFRAAAFEPPLPKVGEGNAGLPARGEGPTPSFLDWLLDESTAYARELGERLKTRVFEEIFPHFARGFIAGLESRPGLGGPDALLAMSAEAREARLQTVFDATLTFLYRLLFLLYAESRDLLPVREMRGYRRISLRQIKETVAEKAGSIEDLAPEKLADAYDETTTALYDDLLTLFAVINRGSAVHNVPIYNGGLFQTDPDPEDQSRDAITARFLKTTQMPDRYLALGLDRLTRDIDPKRGDLGFIDYKSLGVRQLGAIYEGLLEFKVRIAPETMAVVAGAKTEEIVPLKEAKRAKRKLLTEGRGKNAQPRTLARGAVYLENDRRERKATGSYYTPDYIVTYIVRHTVGPVMDEKLADLRPRLQETERRFRAVETRKVEMEGVRAEDLNRPALLQDVAGDLLRDLFDIKVLDPAMGSGHFLVEAVDYVTDRLVQFLDGYPFLATFFEGMRAGILEELRRQEVTVDPAQLTDVTLLKRHVLKRCIYGVDLNPMAVELAKVSLWLDCFTLGAPLSFLDHHLRCGNSLIGAMAKDVAEEMSGPQADGQFSIFEGPFVGLLRATNMIEILAGLADVTLEQVEQSKALFADFERAAKPYKQLLDIHVAQHFGVDRAAEFLKLYGADALSADKDGLAEPYRDVIEQARALYEDKRFFHWDLEFPEVFIDLERADWNDSGGFDAVIGNPPYANAWNMTGVDSEYRQVIETAAGRSGLLQGHWDLYAAFIIRAVIVARRGGLHSFIVPDAFAREKYASALRESILQETQCLSIMHFEGENVFDEVSRHCMIYVIKTESPSKDSQTEVVTPMSSSRTDGKRIGTIHQADWLQNPENQIRVELTEARVAGLIQRIEQNSVRIGQFCYVMVGATVHSKDKTSFTKADIVSDRPVGNARPFIDGKNLSRYEIKWDGRYLDYRPKEMYGPRVPELFESPKVVVRDVTGQNEQLIASYDDTGLYCDHLITCVTYYENLENTGARLEYEGFERLEPPYPSLLYITGVVASRLLTWYFREVFATGTLQGSYSHTYPKQVRAFPIRRVDFKKPESERATARGKLLNHFAQHRFNELLTEVEFLLIQDADDARPAVISTTDTDENSDVVHDLLAYLAEQMIAMHKEKQARVDAFWQELEAATDPATFETLRTKGKWEQSLAKDPACAPYVDADSRSTRNLDDSLGWDAACFEAFAGMLVGKTAVTPALTRVYEAHAPGYRALVTRIEETDDLIDQIVYRLYGLTEEEIAVVEEKQAR
jgi:hypothetical protein